MELRENSITILATFITAILAIAFPLINQIIKTFKHEVSSHDLSELFKRSWPYRFFVCCLGMSIISVFIWIINIEPPQNKIVGPYLEKSADTLVLITTIFLLLSFTLLFRFIMKAYDTRYLIRFIIYYRNFRYKDCLHDRCSILLKLNALLLKIRRLFNSTLRYLCKRLHEITCMFSALHCFFPDTKVDATPKERLTFNIMRDLIFFAMTAGNEKRNFEKEIDTVTRELSSLFLNFKKEKNHTEEKVEFPEHYYNLVMDINSHLSKNGIANSNDVISSSTCSSWLITGTDKGKISSQTYGVLWFNFLTALKHNEPEIIKNHWYTAVNHYNVGLRDGRRDDKMLPSKEKKEFLRFHYLMCACLLYKKKYSLLSRLFDYANSYSEECPLLPKNIEEIFGLLNYFLTYSTIEYQWIGQYPFPDLHGIKASEQKYNWVVRLAALLFVREFCLKQIIFHKSAIPSSKGHTPKMINAQLENVQQVRSVVKDLVNNEELVEVFSFDRINQLEESKTLEDKLDEYLKISESQLEEARKTSPLDPSKISKFKSETKDIISKTAETLQLFKNGKIEDPYNKTLYSNLSRIELFKRDTFSKDPEVSHTNYDTILGNLISGEMQYALGEVLLRNATQTYLIEGKSIKKTISNLGDINDLIIVRFNGAFHNVLKNKSEIIELLTTWHQGIGQSLFIFKKNKKPLIEFIKPENPSPEDFNFNKDDEISNGELNLYAGVKEFKNVNGKIKGWYKNKSEDEKAKSLLAIVLLNMKFTLHEEFEVVRILEYSELRNQGVPDDPDAVEKLK